MEVIHDRAVEETDGEQSSKRQPCSETVIHGKDARVVEDILAWLLMDEDEDSVTEITDLCDLKPDIDSVFVPDSSCGYGAEAYKVRFIDNPYSSTLVYQSSSSYVTINGNEESCGSSFSDTDASVMVNVDTGGLNFNMNVVGNFDRGRCSNVENGGACSLRDEMSRDQDVGSVTGEAMDSCDAFDLEDEVLASLLEEQIC